MKTTRFGMKTKMFLTAAVAFLFISNVNAQSLFVPGGFSSSGIGNSSATGSVGIGTSSPAAYLHILSPNGSATPLFEATEAGTSYGDFFKIVNGTGNTSTLAPTLWAHNGFTNGGVLPSFGLVASTTSAADILSTNAVFNLSARQYNSGTAGNIVNRMLLQVSNLSTNVFTIGATGNVTSTGILAVTSLGTSNIAGALTIGGISANTKINTANYSLFVGKGIVTEELVINLQANWSDYVFAKDYKLRPLSEVKSFVEKNSHLPEVPAAAEIAENGVLTGEMLNIHMKKIEELTLYLIQMEERIKELEVQNKSLQVQTNH
jgi:hypothetical protein